MILKAGIVLTTIYCCLISGNMDEKTTLPRFHKRISEKASDYRQPPVLIVAFGDSVTQGFTKPGTIEPDAVYHARVKSMLERKYARTTFSVINAGVGGMSVSGSREILNRDVIKHNPDLVIIGFGLNDCLAGKNGLPNFTKALETTIESIRENTSADIILLTPNFMCTGDNPNVPPSLKKLVKQFSEIQKNGTLAAYAQAICKIGHKYQIPVADVYDEWQLLAQNGVDTNSLLANGLNHPIPEAQRIPAELILKIINPNYQITVIDELIKKNKTAHKKDSRR